MKYLCTAFFLLLTALPSLSPLQGQTLPSLSVSPTSLSFTYTIGTTTLPAAQTLAIKRSGSGSPLTFTLTVSPAAPWLIFTPTTGLTGTSASVRVNPSSLSAGTYVTVLQADAVGANGPVVATVSLVIKNPPPAMAATPATLSYTWQTDAASMPNAQPISVSTNGEPFTVTAAAAATGGSWLTITPAVGVVISGSPFLISAAVDTTGLLPGAYTGKITLTSLTASNKTITITVTLTVNPGVAVVSSIWPVAAPVNSNDTTITVRGTHLFKASVVKANTTDLTATWISTGVLLAVIPKSMLAAQGTLQITVVNSPQVASSPTGFTVTPPGPQLQTIVNSASFEIPSGTVKLAPGEIITIFGSALGPSAALIATPTNGVYPTTLGTPAAVVEFLISNAWVPAPLIFVEANQIDCQVPFSLPAGPGQLLRVTYNALTSSTFTFDGVAAMPGIFTTDSSGRGQAAALNYDPTTQKYSLNAGATPAAKGAQLVFYVTGAGTLNPPLAADGAVVGTSPPALDNAPSVTIDGDAAAVISSSAVPGALGGLAQITVNVPNSVKAGKELTLVVVVSGQASANTATVAVK
ncbi:MAG: hypothetical protein HY820_36830 [Acidobacteria bacterium]|nr:hypothetical protein [Acidobacteriota bacterium]